MTRTASRLVPRLGNQAAAPATIDDLLTEAPRRPGPAPPCCGIPGHPRRRGPHRHPPGMAAPGRRRDSRRHRHRAQPPGMAVRSGQPGPTRRSRRSPGGLDHLLRRGILLLARRRLPAGPGPEQRDRCDRRLPGLARRRAAGHQARETNQATACRTRSLTTRAGKHTSQTTRGRPLPYANPDRRCGRQPRSSGGLVYVAGERTF